MPSRTNFLIIHGTRGNPDGNWFPWLENKLQKDGTVFVPRFPTPEVQSLESWLAVTNKTLAGCSPENTVLVGHSVGSLLALRLAEIALRPYKAIFVVCPFARELGLKDYDLLNATFIHHPFDWNAVKRGARKIVCLAGDNDPYVPLAYSKEVTDNAGAELIIVKKGGHLNAESGYSEFPLSLEKIREG